MLPLCSAASSCCYHSRILFPGSGRLCSPFRKDSDNRCNAEDNALFGTSNGTHFQKMCLRQQATRSFFSNVVENAQESVSMELFDIRSCLNEFDEMNHMISDTRESIMVNDARLVRNSGLTYVESASVSPVEEGLEDFVEPLTDSATSTMAPVEPETISPVDIFPDSRVSPSKSLDLDKESLPSVKASFDDLFSGVKESFSSSLNQGENSIKNTLDAISSSVTSITKNASEAVDSAVNSVFSAVDQTGDVARNEFSSFSSDLKETSSRAAVSAIDLLRQAISGVENCVTNGVSFIVYSYGSAKELLPPDVRSALSLSEDGVLKVLRPVGAALEQVYIVVEGLERSIGLDPNDPIVPFVLFVGASGTFWVLYWLWAYSGYAGDLSAKSTLELLNSRENSVLIDVRPEALREKDGIPDLRRAARFRYASVTLPEVDDTVKRLLKGGKELDDFLTAVVIKNLKAVQDRSKVIIMDADGTRSKGIARALRKVGIRRSYLVQGGLRSWINEGLRVKELKAETALTILNEEAEAILEEINPSPFQIVRVGVGFIAALYILSEWEKTLQFIGVLGLGQSIFRRVSSYKDSKDLKQDIGLILSPVRLGAQAFSWAAGKLEKNGIGLPTSPSSSDVRSRVLQAAAKHESQPSDTEDLQDASPQETASMNENADLSEA